MIKQVLERESSADEVLARQTWGLETGSSPSTSTQVEMCLYCQYRGWVGEHSLVSHSSQFLYLVRKPASEKKYPILICCLSACTDAHNTNIFTYTHTMYEQSTLEQGYTMTNLIPLTTLYLLGNTDFSVNLKQDPTCKTIPILETNLDLLICCKWERKCTWMKIILAVIICKGLSSEL